MKSRILRLMVILYKGIKTRKIINIGFYENKVSVNKILLYKL